MGRGLPHMWYWGGLGAASCSVWGPLCVLLGGGPGAVSHWKVHLHPLSMRHPSSQMGYFHHFTHRSSTGAQSTPISPQKSLFGAPQTLRDPI